MDHAQAQATFSDYVDGTLPPGQRTAVDQHLAACIQCRTELASFRNTVGSLGRLKQAAPSNFLGDIKQQIYKRSRGRFFAPRWKLFGRIPFEWVSLAMIMAMLIYYIITTHGAPTQVAPGP